ncbi:MULTISPECIES: flagellar filament capping protein FliD [Marinobacter]|jgi:flagellar hook-associated protein 2|uniref:Flagellar hook-associated protein 2 n=1 Tax=Marinobacter nauticus TaxID=2743 RepID=A0A3B8WCZ5_MARNT|nr:MULTISPECIES: flagellar filament capping protein FliD [Marinobacter]MCG8524092.1 flagellar filament capping protein FliD [Pseudomonadales bacterium]RKR77499.1 flagellar hook-associated protein 2 [Marinobacter nauticus]HAC27570.1 flagellar cap protein FliD [Marinobacter nauticus]
MANISALGIGSGVLNSDLVDQLVEAERAPKENRLDTRTQKAELLISAYGTLKSAITELRLPMRQLSAPDNLKAFSATSSNEDVSVTVDSTKASRGTYNVNVLSLAQSQSLASSTFADRDSTSVGTGSFTISSGDKSATLTIDGSNNTLQGLADEINEAGIGVSAGVIDTGSGFRLVLSSEETGEANAISVSVTDDDGNNDDAAGLSQFVFNDTTQNMQETIAAKDARVEINGIEITRSTNSFTDVIDGLSFEAKAEGVTSTIKVEQDFGAVADRVGAFVEKFNALQTTIKGLSGFNAETGQGGILSGDTTIRSIQAQLRNVLGRVVPGLENASIRTLADVGITTDYETGGLSFDRAKFEEQLKKNPDDVTALFAEQGRTSSADVEFLGSGSGTTRGNYAINITQAATQGGVLGDSALADGVVIDGTNDEIEFTVDGSTNFTIQLSQQTYASAADLVAEIQSQIDSNSALNAAGQSVRVGLDSNGVLQFTSGAFGSSSNVSILSVENGAALGLSAKTGTLGKDVAGTVNGQEATGDGRVLTVTGAGGAKGMQLQVAGYKDGDLGRVNFIEGIGEQAVNLVTDIVGADGILDAKTDSLSRDLERIQEERIRLEDRIASYRERLVSQFTAADSLISQLNSTGDYLTQQLAALAPQNNSNR